jgi:eukaryotic-like serine/threonine-protein kinase
MSTPDALFIALQAAVAGRYSLERELGRGGMGVVFLARDVQLDRPVALKLLPPDQAAQPERRERFLSEARMAARLAHPNIVPIHAVEEVGEFVFFAMRYVAGETLGERLRDSRPTWPDRSSATWPMHLPTLMRRMWCTATSSPTTSCSMATGLVPW